MGYSVDLGKYEQILERVEPIKLTGYVAQVIGLVIESEGPPVGVGELCYIYRGGSNPPLPVEVVGFRDNKTLLMPLGEMSGVGPGNEVIAESRPLSVKVGDELLGRVVDGLGEPIDGKGRVITSQEKPVYNLPPQPLQRRRIKETLALGVKSIDGLLTCGKGQRLGIFSGSGVGKSLLLGMIARNTSADINVIALVGERGREVKDFIERDLGEEGLSRSVVVVATSDQPALVRLKAAYIAHTLAEHFRDQGKDVILMLDSVTRLCFAQREVGLAIGEPPATKGYTPSVYAMLPRLLERSGTSERGSITGLYTVLVEADDMTEPVADQVRSILDGHIVLSRELARQNHYPAVDVLDSISRVMIDIVSKEQMEAANKLRDTLATYKEAEDLINIGAYVKGSNPKIDYARSMLDKINNFLCQDVRERADYQETTKKLVEMFGGTE
ncbi:MAG: flagellar protein export ATPase FliI [Armatimonadetes bacterium CG07_land_8_20_14_0_80_40_9]|nr:MAG: flagellar protein export ATPase FliI [Armatimonadetes bacterium CG07_land_8_20_14_0_80_40_9]